MRKIFRATLLKASVFLAASIFVSEAGAAGRGFTMLPGTVKNFELPNFNEKSGWKEWELFGDSAEYIDDSRVDVKGLLLKLYEGSNVLKAEIKSDSAVLNPSTKKVESGAKIFVEGNGFYLEGRGWNWNGPAKTTRVLNDVRARFSRPDKEAKPSDKTEVESAEASISYGGNTNKFSFEKDVVVKGDDLHVECDAIRIDAEKGGSGSSPVNEIEAEGNVLMRREGIEAHAGIASIWPSKDYALLTRKPSLTDLKSKATLAGDKIEIWKGSGKIVASSSKEARALAVFQHSDPQEGRVSIVADKIDMLGGGNKDSVFNFVGNVKIITSDFAASCDKLKAVAKSGSGKPELISIEGEGNVKFTNSSGDAKSDFLKVYPSRSEVELFGNASLEDGKSGMKVRSHKVVFERASDKGRALSREGDRSSFVITTIPETASAEALDDLDLKNSKVRKQGSGKGDMGTLIKSRRIDFSRSGEKLSAVFKEDVSVKSSSANALCDELEVFAVGDENIGTSVRKITARGDVRMSNEGYFASSKIAEIYPKVGVEGRGGKRELRRYIEMYAPENSPDSRPSVTLPPVGNIGLNSADEISKDSSPTVITSDRQYLSSSGDGTDRYFFEGNVEVRGSGLNADCDKIEVVMKSISSRSKKRISQIAMSGEVKMEQGLKRAECDRADIFPDAQMVVMRGNAFVFNKEDNTRVAGPRLTYNAGTRRISMEQSDLEGAVSRPTIVLPSFGTAKDIRDKRKEKE